jgi:hypothetical protein
LGRRLPKTQITGAAETIAFESEGYLAISRSVLLPFAGTFREQNIKHENSFFTVKRPGVYSTRSRDTCGAAHETLSLRCRLFGDTDRVTEPLREIFESFVVAAHPGEVCFALQRLPSVTGKS